MRRWVLPLVLACACREVDAPEGVHPEAAEAAKAPRMLYPSAPGSFVELIKSVRHGVVSIRSTQPVKSGPAAMFPGATDAIADVALGTGFLIESKGVFVITNDHIAAAATDLVVGLPDGSELPARVVGRDPKLDLALLSIDAPRLRALPLGNSDHVSVGEWVIVLGNPFGDEVNASAGIVSATGREAAGSFIVGLGMSYRTHLQIDTRVHRGNTGGPVVDASGQVIGVAVTNQDRPGELAFAIPSNRVREIVTTLREHGQVARGWLGAKVAPVTRELATERQMPRTEGALVTSIEPGSPAARSALRKEDVILRWDDKLVDHASLPWVVANTPVGTPIKIVVWRSRAEHELAITTERMPE
ncbi:MAG: trypsin-like peptidase domain-containing protein [Kofleriaceae bacterium]